MESISLVAASITGLYVCSLTRHTVAESGRVERGKGAIDQTTLNSGSQPHPDGIEPTQFRYSVRTAHVLHTPMQIK